MERHNFFSLPKVDPTTPYQCGTCDFCRQSGVKITPLHCKKHFYCRTCEEFAPKFQRRDYRCRVCSARSRKLNDENMQRIDNFFKTKTGGGKKKDFEEIAFSMEGSKVITFDGSDDENDISGNNDEWDDLLGTLTNEKKAEVIKSVTKRNNRPIKFDINDEAGTPENNKHNLDFMNRKCSFIKMVLPTTEPPYKGSCEKVQSNNEQVCNGTPTSTPTYIPDFQRIGGTNLPINERDNLPIPEHIQPRSNSQTSVKSKSSSDMERSSSPIKAVSSKHGRRSIGWIKPDNADSNNDEERSSSDEFAVIVEGPEFRFTPEFESDQKQKEVDHFWDF